MVIMNETIMQRQLCRMIRYCTVSRRDKWSTGIMPPVRGRWRETKTKHFFYLNKVAAIDKFVHLSHILSDSDLTTLHIDKRWQTLIDMVKSNKEKAEARRHA